MDVFVARQPIFSRSVRVFGYELLYRANADGGLISKTPEVATSTVAVNAFLDFGLGKITNGRRAFLNCDQAFLEGESHLALKGGDVVLEVIDGVTPTPNLIKTLEAAKKAGIEIALDGITMESRDRTLVELCDYVKIDVLRLSRDEILQLLQWLRPFNKKLLAKKVETDDHFIYARDLGFDYFQGFFFAKPKVIQGRAVAPSMHHVLMLLRQLSDPHADVARIDRAVANDVAVSYKLLRYVNSSSLGLGSHVESVRHAVTLLGVDNIRRWVRMIALGRLASGKPPELMLQSLVRARFCELICEGALDASTGFTIGLFSLLDAILDSPMPEIIEELHLGGDLADAMLDRGGAGAHLVPIARGFETGDWEGVQRFATQHRLNRRSLCEHHLDAIQYAHEFYEATGVAA